MWAVVDEIKSGDSVNRKFPEFENCASDVGNHHDVSCHVDTGDEVAEPFTTDPQRRE